MSDAVAQLPSQGSSQDRDAYIKWYRICGAGLFTASVMSLGSKYLELGTIDPLVIAIGSGVVVAVLAVVLRGAGRGY